MGFRFQKRIRIFKGLTLNLSKSGTSWEVGGPGIRDQIGISYPQPLGRGTPDAVAQRA
jgi:hypothetical protein